MDTENSRYHLAKEINHKVELIDGGHSTPEGVAKAEKLHRRIFKDTDEMFMVEIHPIPDVNPEINDDAADVCAALMDGTLTPDKL